MCERVGCAILLCAGRNYREGLKMADGSENLNADYNAYTHGWHSALTYAQDKVQEMHDKKFYELVHMYKGSSTEVERLCKASNIAQLEKVLEVLEDMK